MTVTSLQLLFIQEDSPYIESCLKLVTKALIYVDDLFCYIETIYLHTLLSYHLYIFVSLKPP